MSFQTDLFTKNHSQWVNAYNSPRSHKEFIELRALASPSFKGKLIAAHDQLISTNGASPTTLTDATGYIITKVSFTKRGAGTITITCTSSPMLTIVLDSDVLYVIVDDINDITTTLTAVASGGTPSLSWAIWGYVPATD